MEDLIPLTWRDILGKEEFEATFFKYQRIKIVYLGKTKSFEHFQN